MNPFEDFGVTFANPWWLLALLLIPVLAFLRGNFGGAATVVYSSTAPLRSLGKSVTSRAGNFLSALFYLGLASLIIGMARPQKGTTLSETEANGIDIVLAIDVSRSMLAEDFTIGGQRANRLNVVRKVTEEFIAKRPNDRIGIVGFAGRPYLVSPLTTNHDWLLQNMGRIDIGFVEDGTAIGSAIASSANRLRGDKSAKSRVIILLTDGDNNVNRISPVTAAEAAAALGIKIYAIGAGTEGEAPFPVGRNIFGETEYQMAKFPLDEASLRQIATIGKGEFYRATDTESLRAIYGQIDKLEKTVFETRKMVNYRDLAFWFIAAGCALVVVQAVLSQTVWRRLP